MISTKTLLISAAIAAVVSIGTAGGASAGVVCNSDGDCWHADNRVRYDRHLGVVRHSDDWYFHQRWDDHRHWRDYHEGRGYYRNGLWITL